MKTVIIGVAIAIVAATILLFLNFSHEQYESYETNNTENLSFSRNYPDMIKGNWEPSSMHMERILDKYSEDIKNLGVNTVSIVPEYTFKNGQSVLETYGLDTQESVRNDLIKNIVKAKQKGFAVLLTTNFVGGKPDVFNDTVSLDQFLNASKKLDIEWAAIAEQYQVEFYAPQSEMDWMIVLNYIPNDREVVVSITNNYHQEILPELKKIFSGKLIYKHASNSPNINSTGYDYLGQDFGQYTNSLEEFRSNVKEYYKNMETSAIRSGSDWIVGEFWIPYNGMQGATHTPDGRSYDELQDEIYQIAIDEYVNFKGTLKPKGFFFIAYIMDGMDIRGRPAEQLVARFFGGTISHDQSYESAETNKESTNELFSFKRLPSCYDQKELLTKSHISIENIQNIIPLGNINPKSGHVFPTNHLYFHTENGADVVSPGNIWTTKIVSTESTTYGKDYSIDFSICDDVGGYFIHLTSLSEKLILQSGQDNCEEYETGGVKYKRCEKHFFNGIEMKTGEAIGTVGRSSDFGMHDLRIQELQYANPSRWDEHVLHRVCAIDYYKQDIRENLRSLLGSSTFKRSISPACGEVEQDVPGTAQGVWFVKGTRNSYPEDQHISLVHDNIDPAKPVFSIGSSVKGVSVGTYYFTPKDSGTINRDFDDVKNDGNIYCYELQGYSFVLLVRLENNKLKIEKKSSCSESFGSDYTEFER